MSEEHGRDATLDEVLEAIEELDKPAQLRLWDFGLRLILGTSYRDPADLLNDALMSAINLERRWPIGLPFWVFVQGAMRGIAYNDRHSLRTRNEVLAAELVEVDEEDSDEAFARLSSASAVPSVLDQLISAEERQALLKDRDDLFEWFKDDDGVSFILMAMEDGHRGSAIQSECGMTKTQYETARTRMRRGVAKMLAQRSKA